MLTRFKKQLNKVLTINLVLLTIGWITLPCRAEAGTYRFYSYLASFAEAIYLYESGQLKQSIAKLEKLSAQIEKGGAISYSGVNQPPLIRANTKCGDKLKQLHAEVLELKGLAQFGLEQRALALASLRKAVALCPEHGAVHGSLGSVLVRTKKVKEGLLELNRAIKLDATNREALIMRGQGFDLMNKSREAQTDVARANKLVKDQQKRVDTLAEKIDTLYRDKNLKEALALDEQLLKLAPRDSFVLTAYAEHLMASSRFSEAMRYVSCAINLDPANAYALRIRSSINSYLQKPDLELSDAKKALNTEPRSLEALNSRALALLDNDKPVQALDDYNLVLKRKSDFPDGYINRSTVYLRLGDTAHSIKDAKMAISLAASSPYGYQNLGAAYRRAGKMEEARQALEQSFRYSLQASSDSLAMAHFNLGAVLLSLNKQAEAQTHLDKALSIAPGLPAILLMRSVYDATPPIIDDTSRQLKRSASRMNTSAISKLPDRRTGSKPAIKLSPLQKTSNKSRTRVIRRSLPDLDDALLATNTRLSKFATDASLYNIRAFIYLCKGQYSAAADDFKKCAELQNWQGDVAQRALINYFLCEERLRKTDEAKEVLNAHRTPEGDTAASDGAPANPTHSNTKSKTIKTANTANSKLPPGKPTGAPTAPLLATGMLHRLLIKYLLNEISESELLKISLANTDLTAIHTVCAMHLRTLGRYEASGLHWQWVLNNSDSNCKELVVAAAAMTDPFHKH